MGPAVRRGGPILEARQALLAVALHPFGYGGPRYSSGRGRRRLRPPFDQNPLHDQPSAERGKSRSTMSHESLLSVRSRQPQTVKEALLMSTTLRGNYTQSVLSPSCGDTWGRP